MDNPVLLIDTPILSDEAAAGAYDFLQAFMMAFESHYFEQLRRYQPPTKDDFI
jgi:hypothetical protein